MPTASRSISLERLIELAPPAPAQWVAIADELLRALEREGATSGSIRLDACDIRVSAAGKVEIASHRRVPTDSADEAGVQAVGRLVFDALRGPDGTAASGDPIVLVTLQALAIGALGRTAAVAGRSLRMKLAALTSESNVAARREELAVLVEQIHSGAIPVNRKEPVNPRRGRLPLMAGLSVALAAIIAAAAVFVVAGATALLASPRPHAQPTQLVAQAPTVEVASVPTAPTPTATQTALPPAPAPASAGLVRSVSLWLLSSCAPSARCTGSVQLRFAGGRGPTALAWSVLFYDSCKIPPNTVSRGSFNAPAGWNTVIADSSFRLAPTAHRGWLVVVTSNPAEAASGAVEVAGPSC